jgi:hypothetical protein
MLVKVVITGEVISGDYGGIDRVDSNVHYCHQTVSQLQPMQAISGSLDVTFLERIQHITGCDQQRTRWASF